MILELVQYISFSPLCFPKEKNGFSFVSFSTDYDMPVRLLVWYVIKESKMIIDDAIWLLNTNASY